MPLNRMRLACSTSAAPKWPLVPTPLYPAEMLLGAARARSRKVLSVSNLALPTKRLRSLIVLSMIGALWCTAATAQAWPVKPLRLIVPFPPGGPTDLVGRAAAGILSDALGQAVVVDNRPGGNGTIGLAALAKAAPDGYTVGLTAITLATAPHLGPVPFDALKDFTPISNLVSMTPLIVANPALTANNLTELCDRRERAYLHTRRVRRLHPHRARTLGRCHSHRRNQTE